MNTSFSSYLPPHGQLAGKVAIVTGGASGFGLGIVEKFVSEGASVLIMDLPNSAGSKVSAELSEKYKNQTTQQDINNNNSTNNKSSVLFLGADVTSEKDWNAALNEVLEKFGKLDIVVNNAGISYRNKPTEEVTTEEFEKVFNVNVKGVFLSSKVIVPYFIERKKQVEKEIADTKVNGSVQANTTTSAAGVKYTGNYTGGVFIQISSTAALRPRPGLTWYNATKGAVSTASKTLAVEYGSHQIRFNCICPVAGDTPLLGTFMGADTPEKREQFIKTVPLQRLSRTRDIANATAFLASDDAQFITGVDLEVDGGRCV